MTLTDLFTTYPYNMFAWTACAVAGVSLYLTKRYFGGGVCYSKAVLNGKTAIITGANTGIGLETAVDFAKRNSRVILACRNKEKGETAVVEVKKRSGNENVVFVQLDLSSLESVRAFSSKVLASEPRIDILVNNAGVMACPYAKTDDGFETQFGVNHLAPFLLTHLLLDRIREAPSARIVNLSSLAYYNGKINFDDLNSEQSYSAYAAYNQSKLANILFTRSLAQRLEGTKVTVNALHPGMVRTELSRHFNSILVSYIACILKYFTDGIHVTELFSVFFFTRSWSLYCKLAL